MQECDLRRHHFERKRVFQSHDFSRVFAVRFRARLMKRANLKHLFPSRSPKQILRIFEAGCELGWILHEDFLTESQLRFLCEISSPHTWTKNPLNIGLLAAPLGRFYLFLKVWRFGLGFSLTCQPCFCVLGNSSQWSTWLVHKLWADGNGVIVNICVVFCLICGSAKKFSEHFNMVHSDQSFLMGYQEIEDGSKNCIYYINCEPIFWLKKKHSLLW